MTVRVHRENLRLDWDALGLVLDVAMILLVIANLSLILFDWLFMIDQFRSALQAHTPGFHDFYLERIHRDFLFWDMVFVAVYLTEFVFSWGIAVIRRRYERWFYYPFAHWYDLLGCIPVGGFRWLRVLRVVSLLYRLQKRGIVDFRETWLGVTLGRYYNIVVEEISDRVVINVLEGAQRELRTDTPVVHRIERNVLGPRKEALLDFVAETLVDASVRTHARWREPLGHYLAHLTRQALLQTRVGARLEAIPGAGPRMLATLAAQSEEIGLAFADQLVADLGDPANRPTLDRLLESIVIRAAGDRHALDRLVRDTLIDLLEEVKKQVGVRQWQADGPEL